MSNFYRLCWRNWINHKIILEKLSKFLDLANEGLPLLTGQHHKSTPCGAKNGNPIKPSTQRPRHLEQISCISKGFGGLDVKISFKILKSVPKVLDACKSMSPDESHLPNQKSFQTLYIICSSFWHSTILGMWKITWWNALARVFFISGSSCFTIVWIPGWKTLWLDPKTCFS